MIIQHSLDLKNMFDLNLKILRNKPSRNTGETLIKWSLAAALLLTVGAGTGMASVVDFTSLGVNTCDIDTSASLTPGCTLDNVLFLYDNFGDPTTNGTAQISSNGVDGFAGTGGLGGALEFIFNPTMTPPPLLFGGLLFHFTVGTATGPLSVPDGASVSLSNGDSYTFPTDPTGAGTVAYPWPGSVPSGYIEATVFFTADPTATNFNVSDLAYDTPEPTTYALLASGLFLLGCGRRKLLKRRS